MRWVAWRRRFRSVAMTPPTKLHWPRCAPTSCAKSPPAMTAPGSRTRRLIPLARTIFDERMPGKHQQGVRREEVIVTRDDLIKPSLGTITRTGFENNVEVCVRYLAAWLDGNGCVPIHWLMEDAATAEIARTQLWQWLHDASRPAPGRRQRSRFRPVRTRLDQPADAPRRPQQVARRQPHQRGDRDARPPDPRRHARRVPDSARLRAPGLTHCRHPTRRTTSPHL